MIKTDKTKLIENTEKNNCESSNKGDMILHTESK
jgi:hypothetical protein